MYLLVFNQKKAINHKINRFLAILLEYDACKLNGYNDHDLPS